VRGTFRISASRNRDTKVDQATVTHECPEGLTLVGLRGIIDRLVELSGGDHVYLTEFAHTPSRCGRAIEVRDKQTTCALAHGHWGPCGAFVAAD